MIFIARSKQIFTKHIKNYVASPNKHVSSGFLRAEKDLWVELLGGRRDGQDTVYEEWGKNESLNAKTVFYVCLSQFNRNQKIL